MDGLPEKADETGGDGDGDDVDACERDSFGIVCEDDEVTDMREKFESVAVHLATKLLPSLNQDQQLYFYARFKQTNVGPCNIPKPSIFNFQAKKKWDAWNSLADMTPLKAMTEYVDGIIRLDPNWQSTSSTKKDGSALFGVSVSTLRAGINDDSDLTINDNCKTLLDLVKACNVIRVVETLEQKENENLNVIDEAGMSLLHWASDRGNVEIVDALIHHGADINLIDLDGQTALHYASSCGHSEVVKKLLELGADRLITDNDGLTAENVTSDDNIVTIFQEQQS